MPGRIELDAAERIVSFLYKGATHLVEALQAFIVDEAGLAQGRAFQKPHEGIDLANFRLCQSLHREAKMLLRGNEAFAFEAEQGLAYRRPAHA